MGILQNKAIRNKTAADLLHENSLYPSSVHCAYYACFQLSKHLIIYHFGKTDREIEIVVRKKSEDLVKRKLGGYTVHNYILDCIENDLSNNEKTHEDARTLSNSMGELRRLRNKSDYKEVDISQDKSREAIEYCLSIFELLNKCYP